MTGHANPSEAPYRSAQNIRRLANGSIDYTFYDACARHHRGAAFRNAGRALSTLFRYLVGLAKRPRPVTAPATDAPSPAETRANRRYGEARAPRIPLSKAAYGAAGWRAGHSSTTEQKTPRDWSIRQKSLALAASSKAPVRTR